MVARRKTAAGRSTARVATAAAEAEKAYHLSQDPQFLPLQAYYLTLDRQMAQAVKELEKQDKK